MSNSAATSKSLSVPARWLVIVMLMGYAAIGHFNRVGIGVAGSEIFIPKVGIPATRMGWVYTAFLIVYTICMLPGGWFIDRIGAARTLALYGMTMGTFVALTGVLGWTTTHPETLWMGLLIIRGLAGACSSPLHPGAANVVSDLMSDRRQATANGMITAGALIGIACTYPVFGWIMDRVGWPLAFIISGLALVAYGAAWRFLTASSLPAPIKSPTRHKGVDWRGAVATLSRWNVWLLTLSFAAYGYFQYLFFYWLGYYFEEVLHVPGIESRGATFYILLAMGAGMVVGGVCTDLFCRILGKGNGRRAIVVTGMGLAGVFGYIGVNVSGQWNVTVCLAIAMGVLGMCESVFWTTATDIGGKSRGFSAAFLNTGGNVGGLISPVLTPYMADALGWSGAIAVACGISFVGGLIWFTIHIPEDPVAAQAEAPLPVLV